MAEIRRDVVSGRWVIIATERASRPHDFSAGRGEPKGGFCPFCGGNEDRTPPEISAIRPPETDPDTPGWLVRVVPNKFPALRLEGELDPHNQGLFPSMAGVGAHEVFIESPRHLTSPPEMAPPDYQAVVRTYCRRVRELAGDSRVAHVTIFKNVGETAGASLEHTHSQLIALPVVPRRVHEEMERCRAFEEREGRCLFCEIIERELRDGRRVVLESDEFVALSPYAARFPFETWVLPKYHEPHFHMTDADRAAGFGRMLQETVARLEVCLNRPPYNFVFHTAPVREGESSHYHWHLELIPRVTRVAGFEWATGFYINPMAPEEAAEYMRAVPDERLPEHLRRAAAARSAGH